MLLLNLYIYIFLSISLIFFLLEGKRKKINKSSQEDITNAVLTSSNGYMTRNRLKKELTGK